jgi:hypothetical protein
MTEAERELLFAKAMQYARTNGYEITDCRFVIEHPDGSIVIHFNQPVQEDPTGQYVYCDTPSTICVVINTHTGTGNIPEML